jgi:hypothetical protein
MKLSNGIWAAIIVAVALTSRLSAAPAQAEGRQAAGQAPNASGSDAARVIQTLPPVRFAGVPPTDARQTAFAAALANRQHAEAALRARMEARTNRARVKTICGLTVIEQAPDLDSRILLPADRDPGSAIRKIEPQICTADSSR